MTEFPSSPAAESSSASDFSPTALPRDLSDSLAPVLPFLYIAWADGLLMPAEITLIRDRMAEQEWLSETDRRQIGRWLDPANPPSATTYFGWVRAVREAARRSTQETNAPSLTDLSVELTRMATTDEGGVTTPEKRQALSEIESALGVVGHEAVRDLLHRELSSGDGTGSAEPPSLDAFDTAAMRRVLDGPRADIRDRVRRLLRDPAFARPDPQRPRGEYRDVVLEWTQLLADQGIGSLAYPEYAGGQSDIGDFIAAFETLSYHDLDLVVKFGVQFGLFGGSINQLGTERHRRKYLPRVATLELPGGFAMTERRHGSNVRDLKTTATFDGETDEFVIHTPTEMDHKEWIGNAARHGRVMTVFAQLVIGGENYGVHAFLVPIRNEEGDAMPGVRIEDSGHKMGLNGVDNGRLWFDHVRVPRENLLDRFAQVTGDGVYESPIPSAAKRFFVMLGTLVGGRIAVASGAVSTAKAGLTIAVRYAERRRQFGPTGEPEVPIMDYLSHQRRLLPKVATCYGLTFATHELAERFAELPAGGDTREIEAQAGALKAMASWHATRSLQEAREACGGEGYRWENHLASRKADADIFTTFEGDNTVLMLQVAKSLLAGYRQEFEDLNAFGLLRHLRERVDLRLGEWNPIARRDAGPEHLLDKAFHAELFERRERTLLVSAARRLKGRIDGGMDSFEAFVEVQDHLLTLARAHAEHLVLDAFHRAVARTEDDHLSQILSLTSALYALSHIERDRGWFLEQNLFESNVAKAVRTEVNGLCTRLRPMALELVESFGIPDEVLAAPIAELP